MFGFDLTRNVKFLLWIMDVDERLRWLRKKALVSKAKVDPGSKAICDVTTTSIKSLSSYNHQTTGCPSVYMVDLTVASRYVQGC